MRHGKRGRDRKSSPRQSLNLPDLDQARSAVLNSLPSKESQRGYRHAIDEFIGWYCSEPRLSFNKAVVTLQRPFAIQQDGGFRALVYREAVRMPFHGCRNRSIFFSNLDWARRL